MGRTCIPELLPHVISLGPRWIFPTSDVTPPGRVPAALPGPVLTASALSRPDVGAPKCLSLELPTETLAGAFPWRDPDPILPSADLQRRRATRCTGQRELTSNLQYHMGGARRRLRNMVGFGLRERRWSLPYRTRGREGSEALSNSGGCVDVVELPHDQLEVTQIVASRDRRS